MILGLSWQAFLLLIGAPLLVIGAMFYVCLTSGDGSSARRSE